MFRINAGREGLRTETGARALPALALRLAALAEDTPVTILIHGFRYAPGTAHDAHDLIFAEHPADRRPRVVSWPRHIAKGADRLVIAFGWPARGSIWRATREARIAAAALSALIAEVGRQNREVSILAHSLGARVAFDALAHLPENAVARMVVMFGAVFPDEARASLATPAGRTCEVLNVTSRENLVFDLAFGAALGRAARPPLTIAQGFSASPPHWSDLPIDRRTTLLELSRVGFAIAPPARRVCHWSPYLRPGLFPLYRAFLSGGLPQRSIAALLS